MRRHSRIRTGWAAGAVLALALVTGCEGLEADGDTPASGGGAEAPAAGRAASPLDNPDGTAPGLAPVTGAGRRGGQHLGAPRPLRPRTGLLQQEAHRHPAPGPHLLEGGTQRRVVAGGVVGGLCSVSGHHQPAVGSGTGRTAAWRNKQPSPGAAVRWSSGRRTL